MIADTAFSNVALSLVGFCGAVTDNGATTWLLA